MLREKKYQFLLLALLFNCAFVTAQETVVTERSDTAKNSSSPVIVGDIILSGNKKTKDIIILREIPFSKGETYSLEELVKKFEEARRQLMNTALFSNVLVAAKNIEDNRVNVTVEVKERWYLFPVPYFRPVDRNINQWLFEKNASLDRVNYGVKLSYNNATGHNDKFRLTLMNGYTKQIAVSYDRPYFDKQLKWGTKFSFATGKNREINYNTINDKQVFLKDDNYVRNFTNANFEVSYRRAIKTKHILGLLYANEQVSDTIVALNPSFFKSGRNRISYPGIYYNMTYLNFDFNPYPTKGYAAQVLLSKNGLNSIINLWQLQLKGQAYWPVSHRSFFNLNVYGGIKLPFKQPYFSRRFFGYGDAYVQGYEYYVIDGLAGGYVKAAFAKELMNFKIKVPARKKTKEEEHIPFRIFARVFGNAGYVHDPEPGENTLSNKMLYGGGLGIDIITLYDFTFKLEWTFNSIGQNGLFLHRKTTF